MTVAVVADRVWGSPPLLRLELGPRDLRVQVVPGEPGVARGEEGTLALYAVLGNAALAAAATGMVGLDTREPLLTGTVIDAMLAGVLLVLWPSVAGARGDRLVLRTPDGPETATLVPLPDGRQEAVFAAGAHRIGGTRQVLLQARGRTQALWDLQRPIRGVSIRPEDVPLLSVRPNADPPGLVIRHEGGLPLQPLVVELRGTVNAALPEGMATREVARLESGEEVELPLPDFEVPVRGHVRAMVFLDQPGGWRWPAGVVDFPIRDEGPGERLQPLVSGGPPRFRPHRGGALAEIALGLATSAERVCEHVVVRVRSQDPDLVVLQPELDLGSVWLEKGQVPVGRMSLWRSRASAGPLGLRLEAEATCTGKTVTWFEDVWFDDAGS